MTPGRVGHCQGLLWLGVFFFELALYFRPQIRKLRRELDASQEKVSALTTQLSANVRTNTGLHKLLPLTLGSLPLILTSNVMDN